MVSVVVLMVVEERSLLFIDKMWWGRVKGVRSAACRSVVRVAVPVQDVLHKVD